jgi:hypothetical protein
MDWKGFGRKQEWPNRDNTPNEENREEISLWIVSTSMKVPTEYLPSAILDR